MQCPDTLVSFESLPHLLLLALIRIICRSGKGTPLPSQLISGYVNPSSGRFVSVVKNMSHFPERFISFPVWCISGFIVQVLNRIFYRFQKGSCSECCLHSKTTAQQNPSRSIKDLFLNTGIRRISCQVHFRTG